MGANIFVDKIQDYVGKKLGLWTVLDTAPSNKKSGQYWKCQCECGHIQAVRTRPLVKGLFKGCQKCAPQRQRNTNSIWWKGGNFISSTIFTTIKIGAKGRNIEFDLTIKELEDLWIKQDGKCFYTGVKLTLPDNNRNKHFNASLDRRDSSKSYTKNNVNWVLKEVNIMKMDLPEDRFIELCKLIVNNKEDDDFEVELLNPRSPESMYKEQDAQNGSYTHTYLMTIEEIKEKFGDQLEPEVYVNLIRQATMASKLVVEKYIKNYPDLSLTDLITLIKKSKGGSCGV